MLVLRSWPDELALVQAPSGQPDADAVVHQDLHAVGALVGEQVGVVEIGAAEDGDHPARAVSIPARMSSGAVASQAASMRIIASAPATKPAMRGNTRLLRPAANGASRGCRDDSIRCGCLMSKRPMRLLGQLVHPLPESHHR